MLGAQGLIEAVEIGQEEDATDKEDSKNLLDGESEPMRFL